MGRTGIVLGFERRTENGVRYAEVKVDLGGNNVKTATYYPPPGLDAFPINGDFAVLQDGPGTGGLVCVGFIDPKLAPVTSVAGEVAFFSRSAPGVVSCKIVLKTDGSAVINDKVTIDANGNISANGEVSAMATTPATAVKLSTHLHPTAMGPSGAPTPGT